jgi:hypothetical protein
VAWVLSVEAAVDLRARAPLAVLALGQGKSRLPLLFQRLVTFGRRSFHFVVLSDRPCFVALMAMPQAGQA